MLIEHFEILRRIAEAGKTEAEQKSYNVDIFIHLLDEIERAKIECLKMGQW